MYKIGAVSTVSALAGDALEADNCEHCHASYGHTILCPLLNRNIAEAKSAVNSARLSEADNIRLTSLGVRW